MMRAGSAVARLLALLQPAIGAGAASSVPGDAGAVFVFCAAVVRHVGEWQVCAWVFVCVCFLCVRGRGQSRGTQVRCLCLWGGSMARGWVASACAGVCLSGFVCAGEGSVPGDAGVVLVFVGRL
jgi:hypothetical protein